MTVNEDVNRESANDRSAIGLDVGGTKISGGVVAESGHVLCRRVIPTMAARGGVAVLADVLSLARDLKDIAVELDRPPVAIGLGLCELVDPNGIIQSDQTVKWRDLPVAEVLSELCPTFLEADSRAAALCESRLGAGKGLPTFLYVTIGTGISCCLVIAGAPYVGARGNTGTMATSPTSVFCRKCGEISSPVLEEIASGPALAMRFNERTGSTLERAQDVFAVAEQGNSEASYVLETSGDALGSAIGLLINVLDPHAVITGGGLGSTESPYWHYVERSARRHIWADSQRDLPILRAAFGEDAGLIGAALHGLESART